MDSKEALELLHNRKVKFLLISVVSHRAVCGHPCFSDAPSDLSVLLLSYGVEKTSTLSSSSPRLSVWLPSASFVTPKPWNSSSSPVAVRAGPLVPRGLTDTLIQDFEERQAKLKLEESAVSFLLSCWWSSA